MSKGIIILTFIFVFLLISGIFLYFIYEKPKQEQIMNIETYNLTLKYIDSITKQQISTGFLVYLDNAEYIYQSGETTDNNYIFLTIPLNHTFYIANKNILNQSYYISRKEFNSYNSKDVVNNIIELIPYGKINITTDYKLSQSKEININISADGEVRCLSICTRNSIRIVNIKMQNSSQIDIPKRLVNKVDKCFSLKDVLINNISLINLTYTSFGTLNQDDSIKLYVLDGNYDNFQRCKIEDEKSLDLGIKDIEYIINYNQ